MTIERTPAPLAQPRGPPRNGTALSAAFRRTETTGSAFADRLPRLTGLGQTLDHATELDRRRVRSGRPWHTGEGESGLLTRIVHVDHHDLAGLQLGEQDLLRHVVLDVALDGPT